MPDNGPELYIPERPEDNPEDEGVEDAECWDGCEG